MRLGAELSGVSQTSAAALANDLMVKHCNYHRLISISVSFFYFYVFYDDDADGDDGAESDDHKQIA